MLIFSGTAFTFWQRFYPNLILAAVAYAGLVWLMSGSTDPAVNQSFYLNWAGLVGGYLFLAAAYCAGRQFAFRLGLSRMRRMNNAIARGKL
jgi:hypothetical protein